MTTPTPQGRTLLLIDNRIEDKPTIINSLMSTTDYIIMDYFVDNLDSLINKLTPFANTDVTYNSIGLIQINYTNKPYYTFLKKAGASTLLSVERIDPELNTWRNFIMFLQYLKREFVLSNFDFIECNINNNDWKYIISTLENKLDITIRTSTKVIGELTEGDNWELDTANNLPEKTNLISLYFTANIINYGYKLDSSYYSFACVTTDGNVLSSGSRTIQYGNPSVTNSSPAAVFMKNIDNTANLSGAVTTSTGPYTTSVLLNDGTVVGCGNNWTEQLGLGINTINNQNYIAYTLNPSGTDILRGVVGISTGYSHTLYLLNDSTVVVAGMNYRGEFGNGTYGNSSNIPLFVKDPNNVSEKLTGVTSISACFYSSAFLLNNGTVLACGKNGFGFGLFGNGTLDDSVYPTPVKNPENTDLLRNVKQISLNFFSSMFLLNTGNVLNSGYNCSGKFGIGDINVNNSITFPVYMRNIDDTDILTDVVAISSNFYDSLMLMNDGTVMTCGYNNNSEVYLPIYVRNSDDSILNNVIAINTLNYTSIFMLSDHTILMSGRNQNGTFGTQRFDVGHLYYTPVSAFNTFQTVPYTGISNISITSQNLVFIKGEGEVFGIGYNGTGLLGLGNNLDSITTVTQMQTPANTGFINGVFKVIVKNNFIILLMSDATVLCCGDNGYGQFGNGTTTSTNLPVNMLDEFSDTLTNIADIACGYIHTVALTGDGHVYVCGSNEYGQLGLDSSTTTFPTTSYMLNLGGNSPITNAVAISCGSYSTFVILPDGSVLCCGYNNVGQLGDGTTLNRSYCVNMLSPTSIGLVNTVPPESNVPITGVSRISSSANITLAIFGEANVCGCGSNNSNALINTEGEVSQILTPVTLEDTNTNTTLFNIAEVGAGYNFTVFLLGDGKILCKGSNAFSQFGIGPTSIVPNTVYMQKPLPETGDLINAAHICVYDYNVAIILQDGTALVTGMYNSEYNTRIINDTIPADYPMFLKEILGEEPYTLQNINETFGETHAPVTTYLAEIGIKKQLLYKQDVVSKAKQAAINATKASFADQKIYNKWNYSGTTEFRNFHIYRR